jgi:hypothetical protein
LVQLWHYPRAHLDTPPQEAVLLGPAVDIQEPSDTPPQEAVLLGPAVESSNNLASVTSNNDLEPPPAVNIGTVEEPSAESQPKIPTVAVAPAKVPKMLKCGECKGLVTKGFTCDICSSWMHESCGVKMNPQDSKNCIRNCSSHFPKTTALAKDDPTARRQRPRCKVTPKKQIPSPPPQRAKKQKIKTVYGEC